MKSEGIWIEWHTSASRMYCWCQSTGFKHKYSKHKHRSSTRH